MDNNNRPAAPLLSRVLLIILVICSYLPILMMFLKGFSEPIQGGSSVWSLRWFKDLISDTLLLEATIRSLTIATISSTVATFIGTMASIAMIKTQFFGKDLLRKLSLISLSLPEIVFALSLLSWFFILKLTFGSLTVIIAHVSFTLAYVITTVSGRLVHFGEAIDDAARDLGASEFTILTKITLPMLRPALGGAFVLGFLLSFDDFLITYFVNGMGNDTLPVLLYSSIKYDGITPKLNALSSILFLGTSFIMFVLFKLSLFGGVSGQKKGL